MMFGHAGHILDRSEYGVSAELGGYLHSLLMPAALRLRRVPGLFRGGLLLQRWCASEASLRNVGALAYQ